MEKEILNILRLAKILLSDEKYITPEVAKAEWEKYKKLHPGTKMYNEYDYVMSIGKEIRDNLSDEVKNKLEEHFDKEYLEIDGKLRSTRNSDDKFIHSTEEGVRNFWRWFGDSKVVDKKGRPLVVYHSTPESAPTDSERYDFVRKLAYTLMEEEEKESRKIIYDKINKRLSEANLTKVLRNLHDLRRYVEIVGEDWVGKETMDLIEGLPSWHRPNPFKYIDERRDKLSQKELKIIDQEPFSEFDINRAGKSSESQDAKVGIFFTDDLEFSKRFLYQLEIEDFTGKKTYNRGKLPKTYATYLSLENPIDLAKPTKLNSEKIYNSGVLKKSYDSAEDLRFDMLSSDGSKDIQRYIASFGRDWVTSFNFDGIINKIKYEKKMRREYIALYANKIKSIYNTGEFSSDSNDIYE